jgi:non-specific serine/threonine protein kinase/serine/threonine-protein kinase
MSAELQRRAHAIASKAIEVSIGERTELLDRECGADGSLRAEVERLLAAEALAEAQGFLSGEDPLIGSSIGPYRIQGCLGQGGMGVVYLAEQTRPIRRMVALKIIKLGMDTRQVIARFEAERDALSLMNHPNVAKVLDAGATDTGRPYFAMEFVEGTPITTYCDEHRLNTGERLKVFMNVCTAVQHAHQKGIIHRDIKPSNVLVTEMDGKPVPKVIDFGIAKATQQHGAERTFFTETGQLVGTPAYMSPEQAGGNQTDIDTRTDVYSLGILLYELLAGIKPFDDATLRNAGYAEIQRIIREVDPPKPSARLSSAENSSTSVPTLRKTTFALLKKELRRDLDWVIMKCLEKDRDRRYETVNALVMEIYRFLNHEPVLVNPPGATYRLRKFIRRRRGFVTAAGLVFAVLLIGCIATGWQALATRRESQKVRASLDFLHEMLRSPDPLALGHKARVIDMLDLATAQVEARFAGAPEVAASIWHAFARTYEALGMYEQAEKHARLAVDRYSRDLGHGHRDTLDAIGLLALVLHDQDRLEDAEPLYLEAIEGMQRTRGPVDRETLTTRHNLALLRQQKGEYDTAERMFREIAEVQKSMTGSDGEDSLTTMNSLAVLLRDTNRSEGAESLQRTVLEGRRSVLGSSHPDTLSSMHNLGVFLADSQRPDEAEPLLDEVVRVRRQALGPAHPQTLESANALGGVYYRQKRLSEAEIVFREVAGVRIQALGEDHSDTQIALNNVATVLRAQGKWEEARNMYERVVDTAVRTDGEAHENTCIFRGNLGLCLTKLSHFVEAEKELLAAHSCLARARGESDGRTREVANHLVGLYEAWETAVPGEGHAEKASKSRAKSPE